MPFDPPRVADAQKCVRAGGQAQRPRRHRSDGTAPELLRDARQLELRRLLQGRGDPWAWELLTEPLGLDADRLWVTVHVSDDEAEELWVDEVGFPRQRIQRLDKDNFWEMGDVGPCGPCSEIFWDYGPAFGPDGGPADPAAEDRYVEIWNLVFMQFFRRPDGALEPLPKNNVDTGAGLERMLTAINGVDTVWETDVLAGLIDTAQSVTGRRLGQSDDIDVALKIVADHTRTMTFLVADGVVPVERRPGLRAAPHHPARRPLRPPGRRRAHRHADPDRRVHRGHGRRLPRAAHQARRDHRDDPPRGGGVPPHAQARRRPARPAAGRGPGRRHVAGRRRLRPLRDLRVPARGHRGGRRRGRTSASTAPATTPPSPGPSRSPRPEPSRSTPTPTSTRSPRSSTGSARPSSSAVRSSRPRRRCSPSSATRSSSTGRRSTPSRAARSATPGGSRPTPAGPRCATRPTACPGLHRHVIEVVEGTIEAGPGGHRRHRRRPARRHPPQPHRHPRAALGPPGGARRHA